MSRFENALVGTAEADWEISPPPAGMHHATPDENKQIEILLDQRTVNAHGQRMPMAKRMKIRIELYAAFGIFVDGVR